jgi:hypothetical protein
MEMTGDGIAAVAGTSNIILTNTEILLSGNHVIFFNGSVVNSNIAFANDINYVFIDNVFTSM